VRLTFRCISVVFYFWPNKSSCAQLFLFFVVFISRIFVVIVIIVLILVAMTFTVIFVILRTRQQILLVKLASKLQYKGL
jgi:hypothetical protein